MTTPTIRNLGNGKWEVEISETGISGTTEVAIPCTRTGEPGKLPGVGRLISQRARLVSGSATAIDPILGERSDPAANAERITGENNVPGALVYNQGDPPVPYNADPSGNIYHRSRPDGGADNAVITVYQFVEDWT